MTAPQLVVALAFAAGLLFAQRAEACSCLGSGPPCNAVWATDAVFVGRVAEVSAQGAVKFDVDRGVRGIDTPEVTLDNTRMGDCAYPFRAGETYVVYAYRDRETNALTTTICSRTAPLSKASADLAYFDEMNRSTTGARVYGRIRHVDADFVDGGGIDRGPVAGLTLTLVREANRVQASTDAAGQFDIRGLTSGDYELQANIPPQFVQWQSNVLRLPNDRACVEINSIVRLDGRIRGTLFDEDGLPASRVVVEAAAISTKESDGPPPRTQSATTARDGTFEIGPLPDGDYVVGTELALRRQASMRDRRRYYPGVRDAAAAQTIHLGAGSRVQLDSFRLPALSADRVIDGVVLRPDGTIASGATVTLFGAGPEEHVTSDGRFRFTLPYGATFSLWARITTTRDGKVVGAQTDRSVSIGREDSDRTVELRLRNR